MPVGPLAGYEHSAGDPCTEERVYGDFGHGGDDLGAFVAGLVTVGRRGGVVGRPLILVDVDRCGRRAELPVELARLGGVAVSRRCASVRLESGRSEARGTGAGWPVQGRGPRARVCRRCGVAICRRCGVVISRRWGVRIRLCGVRLRCRCRTTPATSGPMLGQSFLLVISLHGRLDRVTGSVGGT